MVMQSFKMIIMMTSSSKTKSSQDGLLGAKSRIQNAKMCMLEAKTGRNHAKVKGENGYY